jgi:glycosyltransferase involved in cell wall biosynthesis
MDRRTPKVSIGLPVYNGEKYLENALTRLLQQDYEDFELIISDNASTDRTQEICLAAARKDHRIRYFRNEYNSGLAANHNRTFEVSRGQYFKWAAHDDDFPELMLGRFVRVLDDASSSVCLVYSFCQYIDEQGKLEHVDSDGIAKNDPWPHKRLAHLLRYVHMYNSIYGLVRSEVLRKTRLHGTYPGSDHVLLAELEMLGILVEIPEPLLRIRRHQGRSWNANRTVRELRELFNPGRGHRWSPLGVWGRINLELVRSALTIPLRPRDRVMCFAVALVVPQYWWLRSYLGRQRRKFFPKLSPRSQN